MTQNEPRAIGEILSELLPKYLAFQPTRILNVAQENDLDKSRQIPDFDRQIHARRIARCALE